MVISETIFAILMISLLWMCPYNQSRDLIILLGIGAMPNLSLTSVFLILVSLVKPKDYRSILISIVWKIYSRYFDRLG